MSTLYRKTALTMEPTRTTRIFPHMLSPRDPRSFTRHVLLGLFLFGLFVLSFRVLRLFIVPVVWSLILAYVTWPAYRRLRAAMGGYATLSAILMTLLLTTAFVLPLLWLIGLLQQEFVLAYKAVSAYLSEGPLLPEPVRALPWIGTWLQELLNRLAFDPAAVRAEALQWLENSIGQVAELIGGVGRNAVKMAMVVITVLFVYRDGESLLNQVRKVSRRFIGVRANAYLAAIATTTTAVLYGLLLTAIAQGILAGIGYWAAGIRAPALLGALTALVALLPFGAPFVWGSLGVWLLMSGDTWSGVGLLLWGMLVVSWVDNLIRPLVISSATRIPFLLVMFGVLGGIAAFGLVGMFVGPIVMAVLLAVWREWVEEEPPKVTQEDAPI